MEGPNSLQEAKTLVLFGRVGNGKSDLGNSILGKAEFLSRLCASGVTTTSKLGTTTLDDGQVVNVIDTPGLFDSSRGSEYYTREMVKCITLAKDGIDGFILVCSVRTRFSTEEEGVLQRLREIFSDKIVSYMIVVFTGGDELQTTFNEYLISCPPSLQRVLQLCKHRVALFDNKTRDETKRKNQVQQLMALINMVRAEKGQSYTGDVFEMIQNAQNKEESRALEMKQVVPYNAQQNPDDGGSGNATMLWFDTAQKLKKELETANKNTQMERDQREKVERENEILKNSSAEDRRGETSMLDIVHLLIKKSCTIM